MLPMRAKVKGLTFIITTPESRRTAPWPPQRYAIATNELPSLIRFPPRDVLTMLVFKNGASLVDGRHNVLDAKGVGQYNALKAKPVG